MNFDILRSALQLGQGKFATDFDAMQQPKLVSLQRNLIERLAGSQHENPR